MENSINMDDLGVPLFLETPLLIKIKAVEMDNQDLYMEDLPLSTGGGTSFKHFPSTGEVSISSRPRFGFANMHQHAEKNIHHTSCILFYLFSSLPPVFFKDEELARQDSSVKTGESSWGSCLRRFRWCIPWSQKAVTIEDLGHLQEYWQQGACVQWLFLVPLKGGRWHIIPQLAGKIPLIYHLYIAFWGLYATYHLLGEPETTIDV